MKTIYKIILLSCVLLAGTHLWANDTIRFTWAGAKSSNSMAIRATLDKTFTVNWGNGQHDTYTGEGASISVFPSHTYTDSNHYTVSISGDIGDCFLTYLDIYFKSVKSLDVSNTTALTYLDCHSNQLNNLDISQNTALTYLSCEDNKLSTLDVSKNVRTLYCHNNRLKTLNLSGNTALTTLWCYNNALPLADLYKGSQKIGSTSNKYLGTQTLDSVGAALNTPTLITSDTLLGGVATQYAVTKNETPAVLDIDYTLAGNRITFKTNGIYNVEMTNGAITSYTAYPAKVIATYEVDGAVGIEEVENAQTNVKVYPNPVNEKLRIEGDSFATARNDGGTSLRASAKQSQIQFYDLAGKLLGAYPVTGETTEINISHLPSGVYLVKVGNETVKVIKN